MALDASLLGALMRTVGEGRVEWIGLRPSRRAEVRAVERAVAETGRGLQGDHSAETPGGKRHITLIQHEHLPVIAALAKRNEVKAEWLRRNLVVSGINLLALKDRRFFVGEVLLQGTGACPPCSRMEETLGYGGYSAMRGHGGITAQVCEGGEIRMGDRVRLAA